MYSFDLKQSLRMLPSCFALSNHGRLFSGTSTNTNSYDSSLPPPFSFTYPYGDTAATVPLPQRHLFALFNHVRFSFRHSHYYQSLRRQPPPFPYLRAIFLCTLGTATFTNPYGGSLHCHHRPPYIRAILFLSFNHVGFSIGTPNHAVYLRVLPQRRRGRGGSPFTV